jgi:hypothetical protein
VPTSMHRQGKLPESIPAPESPLRVLVERKMGMVGPIMEQPVEKAVSCGAASGKLDAFPSRLASERPQVLGPPKPRFLDWPVTVSLEDLVPADNVYRHLEMALDLGFVRN